MAEALAYAFHTYVIDMVKERIDDKTVVCDAFRDFEGYVVERYGGSVKVGDVYKQQIYDWYYGNVLNFLYTLALQAEVYLGEWEGSELRCKERMSEYQKRSCVLEALRIMQEYGVGHACVDYYGNTLYTYAVDTTRAVANAISEDNKRLMLFVARHGGAGVLEVQKDLVRVWRAIKARKLRKKKALVARIEDRWFEILNSPYTRPGARLLEKRAQAFRLEARTAGW